MSVWRWADDFESVPPESRVTMGEGDTPVVRSQRLGAEFGIANLYFKLESCNPSGSYKDRFAFAALSHMRQEGQRICIATTSGNTGAALAAYSAAAGVSCNIAVVETAPIGKLQQMLAHRANLFRIRRFGLDPDVTENVLSTLQSLGERPGVALQISAFRFSPLGMSGVRTISLELAEQFAEPIDHVFTQAGGGGMTLAIAGAFQDLHQQGRIDYLPRVECVQPEGNNTIAGPLRDGMDRGQQVSCTSQISGLQVANVIDGDQTISACRATGGTGHLISDPFIWEIQRRLATDEGIFCEPAGAVATAGAFQAVQQGLVAPDATVVCLITGTGFKDPQSVERMIPEDGCELIEADALADRILAST